MKNGFDGEQNLSQAPVRLQNRSLELSPRQAEIHRNLEAIGPEIAAFYLSGVKVLQDDDLETSSYLLAHIAREIEGGLRDVLSAKRKEELKFVIETPDGNKLTCEKGKEGSFKFASSVPGTIKVTYNRIGKHKASILQSLGVDENSPIAERWISVAKRFAEFAHRHGAWKPPRRRKEFFPLWHEFEKILAELVGNYLNLLNRLDRILTYEQPTEEIIKTLPNLLKSETRREYFFKNLDSPAWLQPLKEDGWFDPESNVIVRPNRTSVIELDWYGWWKPIIDSGWFDAESNSFARTSVRTTNEYNTVLPWHALEYAERIAEHTKKHPCAETIGTLVEIVDIIVDCAEDTREKIIGDRGLCQRIINIIFTLPKEKMKSKHYTFMEPALENWHNEHKVNIARGEEAHHFIESIEQGTNPALREFLSNRSRADRIKFPGEIREIVEGENHRITESGLASVYTEQGLANIYREYVVVILQRFTSCLSVFQDILSPDQYSTLSELLTALHNTNKIDWEALLGFIHGILSSEDFWVEHEIRGFKYRDQFLADTAELIAVGVNDDTHAFDPQFLPLAEQILLVLVEKIESKCGLEKKPMDAFLNSSRGMVFRAMMGYTLRFTRTNNNQQKDSRWPQAIRADFTKRLDRNLESSFEFSFMLGTYLPQLLYLDQEWVIDNVNRIFPKNDEHHWYVVFSMYLISSGKICKYLYTSLKEGGHYQKALNTNFDHHPVETALATHICTFWLEDYEELSDKTSLIYQVVNSSNVNYLSAIVDFCWDQRDNLSEEDKAKVRAAWRVMFKTLSQNKDEEIYSDEKIYPNVLDKLSKWVVFIDSIDEEVLEWLKLSVRHVTWDIGILVKTLLLHAPETPTEVGIVYLELSKKGIGELLEPFLEQDEVIETIRILYNAGPKEIADKICIRFAKNGYNVLKPLYNEYQH